MVKLIRDVDITCRVNSNILWKIQCRSYCWTVVTTESSRPSTGYCGNNSCGDRYLADAVVPKISDVDIA